jgi:hypothetical protein
MVSGFIDEKDRYLALTQEEYGRAKVSSPNIQYPSIKMHRNYTTDSVIMEL